MHRSDEAMIFIGNFNKNSFISVISVAKQNNFVVVPYSENGIIPRSSLAGAGQSG